MYVFSSREVTTSTPTAVTTTREGARSPTPNAIGEIEPAFQYLDAEKSGFYIWRIQVTHTLKTLLICIISYGYLGWKYFWIKITTTNANTFGNVIKIVKIILTWIDIKMLWKGNITERDCHTLDINLGAVFTSGIKLTLWGKYFIRIFSWRQCLYYSECK